MSSHDFKKITQDNLQTYIDETITLCKQPSISAEKRGIRECSELVFDLFLRYGFEVMSYETPGNPIIIAHLKGKSEKTLLFYNHYDVQPVDPVEEWTSDPFDPQIRDGILYARGAKDDKGELVARLAAVDVVRKANGGELPCSVVFLTEGEEEVGSPTIVDFVNAHKQELKADAAIWEESYQTPEYPIAILGNRGMLYVELVVRTLSQDAHSGAAHTLPNAGWRLTRALQTLKDENEKVLIPGFYEHAHKPSEVDRDALLALTSMEQFYKTKYGIDNFVNDLTGDDYKLAVFNPTCNIAGISTGYQGDGIKTVVPAVASVKIDFRLVPDQDPGDIFTKLRKHLDDQGFPDVEVKLVGRMDPCKTEVTDPFVRLAAETSVEVYGKKCRPVPFVGGSSPRYALNNAIGPLPILTAGAGYWNNCTHAPDEHLRLEDLEKGIHHLALIISEFNNLN